jgi:hypothetical protein
VQALRSASHVGEGVGPGRASMHRSMKPPSRRLIYRLERLEANVRHDSELSSSLPSLAQAQKTVQKETRRLWFRDARCLRAREGGSLLGYVCARWPEQWGSAGGKSGFNNELLGRRTMDAGMRRLRDVL